MISNTASTAAAGDPSAASSAPTQRQTLVWDLPVRLFHWLLAASFAGAWLTAESERLHLIHITLGYTMGGLVVFRLVWGLIGSSPARFANFVRGPAAALRYLRSLTTTKPEHHRGHNPAGALAIVALLGLVLLTAALGWATETERLPAFMDEAHEAVATGLMAVVCLHLLGVAVGSWRHRENLPRSMVDGRKAGSATEGLQGNRWPMAALLLAAVLGFWAWQWHSAPDGTAGATLKALGTMSSGGDEDGENDQDND